MEEEVLSREEFYANEEVSSFFGWNYQAYLSEQY
jgi:hypothetical protein